MHFCLKSQSIHCHCCFSITTFYRSPMEWRRLCFQPCVSVCSQGAPYRALAPDILCKGLIPPAQGPSPVPTYRALPPDRFRLVQVGPHCTRTPSPPHTLVHYAACTIGKASSWYLPEMPSCYEYLWLSMVHLE